MDDVRAREAGPSGASLRLICHGVRLELRASPGSLLAELTPWLPPGWRPDPAPAGDPEEVFAVSREGGRYEFRVGPAAVLETEDPVLLQTHVDRHTRRFVAYRTRERVFIHSGAVAWGGVGVIAPGVSYSGKSNLTTALVRAGAVYYSDDCAVLDDEARLHPFARPLSIRQGDGPHPLRRTAEQLGGRTGTGPVPVGLVLIAWYEPGAEWRPSRLSPGDGLLALLAHAAPTRDRPRQTLEVLGRLLRGAEIYRGPRGEAEQVVEFLRRRLGAIADGPGVPRPGGVPEAARVP